MLAVNSIEKHTLPDPAVDHSSIVVAVVGYRNSCDVATCLAALSRATARNFTVSICENGGIMAYRTLIHELAGLVEPTNDLPKVLDERVAETWSGRLLSGNQKVRIYRAK